MYNGRFRIMLAHHRGPYKQSAVIAALILIALFVFFPPFEFQPYRLQAEVFEVIEVPENFEIPPPPKDVAMPPPSVTAAPGDDEPPLDFPEYRDINLPSPPPLINESGFFTVFDELPVPEYLARPVYPVLAREAGIEGTVMLKVRIGVDHRVHAAVIMSSDVTPAMEQAAIEAALKCRYTPAKQRNVEVEVWVPILIRFTLN